MKKKLPLNAQSLPEEIAMIEGLKIGINIAQLAEAVNCVGVVLANNHNTKDVLKWLARFRGKPFGFWRKSYRHHGNK